jgi:hypothetical protein
MTVQQALHLKVAWIIKYHTIKVARRVNHHKTKLELLTIHYEQLKIEMHPGIMTMIIDGSELIVMISKN